MSLNTVEYIPVPPVNPVRRRVPVASPVHDAQPPQNLQSSTPPSAPVAAPPLTQSTVLPQALVTAQEFAATRPPPPPPHAAGPANGLDDLDNIGELGVLDALADQALEDIIYEELLENAAFFTPFTTSTTMGEPQLPANNFEAPRTLPAPGADLVRINNAYAAANAIAAHPDPAQQSATLQSIGQGSGQVTGQGFGIDLII